MARGVNKVILVGHLGGDPEVRYLPNGNAVAQVSLATSEAWKDKQTGQPQERTEWHRLAFFGKVAEIVGEFARKGSLIYVEGMLRTRKWQGQDGQDKYTTEVVIDSINGRMQLLDRKEAGDRPPPHGSSQRPPQQRQQRPQEPGTRPTDYHAAQPAGGDYDSFDDDIPFMDPYRFSCLIV